MITTDVAEAQFGQFAADRLDLFLRHGLRAREFLDACGLPLLGSLDLGDLRSPHLQLAPALRQQIRQLGTALHHLAQAAVDYLDPLAAFGEFREKFELAFN